MQRVRDCAVSAEGSTTGSIDNGLLVYLGVEVEDTDKDLEYLADKVLNLRIFEDDHGKMNRSAMDLGMEILVVSQFTLCADVRKGRRPSYSRAADPELAERCYRAFIDEIGAAGLRVQEGKFQAMMTVTYSNMGPVTMLLDSRKRF